MERLVNSVRDFVEDDQINWRVKCLIVMTGTSLTIAPIVVLITVLSNDHSTSQTALYILIFDITAICASLVFWLGRFFQNRNKVAVLRRQETIRTILQHQSNTSNVENQPGDRYAPVGNEVFPLYNSTLSANRCRLSPKQECIPSNDTPFNFYEDVSIPTARPIIPPKTSNGGKTYTLYSLEGGQETFIGAEASLNADNSRFCSRVPLKCCLEADKACPNARNVLNSGEIFRGRQLSPGSQKQNDFRSSSRLTNQSRQIGVPGIQPPSKDVSYYCGTRRTRSLPRKRFRTLPVRQAVADGRVSSITTSEEDLITNCDSQQNPHALLRHSNTLPPLIQDRNSVVVQERPSSTMNEKNPSNNPGFGRNRGVSRRKRCKSAPSSRSKDFEGRSSLKSNENSFNSSRTESRMDTPTNNIVLPPSPSNSRPRLLHGLLSAILTSNTSEPEFGSSDSTYFQPQASGGNSLDDDPDRPFPVVSYEETSSKNYLVHIAMMFTPKEFQKFLSKRELV